MVKLVDKQNIFNSGILSSKLYSRDDLKQYNNGVADAMNFVCSRYGPLEKRTGTEFICDLGNPGATTFLLPFIFSIHQTLLLEFIVEHIEEPESIDQGYIRFYTFGTDSETGKFKFAPVEDPNDPTKQFKIETPFSEADIKKISYVQSLDTVYLAFDNKEEKTPPYVLIRKDKYEWSLEPFEAEDGPYLNQNYKTDRTVQITDTNVDQSVVLLKNFNLTEEDIGRWIRICTPRYNENTYAYEDKWSYGKIADLSDKSWTLKPESVFSAKNETSTAVNDKVYINEKKKTSAGTITAKTSVTEGTQITVKGKNYIYTRSVNSKTWEWIEKGSIIYLEDNPAPGQNVYSDSAKTTVVGTISSLVTETIDEEARIKEVIVTLTGATKTSTFVNKANGIIVDWSYRNYIAESDQTWMTKATSEWKLGVWNDTYGNEDYPATYPTKVTIHQQRLVWAGMTDRPWIWMSNSFAYKNYAPSDFEGEITDTNSIYYDISSSKISEIFWIASIKSLLIGTELGEIRLYSGGTAITPSDVVSNMESSYGCHNADPVLNDDNIVYIQRLQRTVRSLSYDYNQDAFLGPELTILAEGLTVGGIKKIAFQKEPNNTYWCLKEDGSLLSLTYDKAQDVIGWSQSKIAGTDVKVVDMAVLPSSFFMQDMLILCIERKVNGVTKRYMELLTKNFNKDISQAEVCYLDCAKRVQVIDDIPRKNIIDLDYLEGQKVRVMDEGAFEGEYEVHNGQITLATACKDVWVGLPYEAYLDTLERDYQDKQLSTKMSKLRVYKLRMYLERSLGIEIKRLEEGSETKLITFDPSKNMDEAPTLLTGKVDIPVGSAWNCDYRLRLTSEPGFPCTVAGFIIGVEINEL